MIKAMATQIYKKITNKLPSIVRIENTDSFNPTKSITPITFIS